MPTGSTLNEIENFLLGLVARDRNISIETVREEGLRFPHDPPWSSEEFVHYQFEIEREFGLDFDAVEVERVQRDIKLLATHIRELILRRVAESA